MNVGQSIKAGIASFPLHHMKIVMETTLIVVTFSALNMFATIINLKYYHYNIGISLISNSLIPCEFKWIVMYLPDIWFSSVNFLYVHFAPFCPPCGTVFLLFQGALQIWVILTNTCAKPFLLSTSKRHLLLVKSPLSPLCPSLYYLLSSWPFG